MEMFDSLLVYASSRLENMSLAEEAVQETFRIACMKAEVLCTSNNPNGWLFVTLKNTISNMLRNQKTASQILTAYIASEFGEIAISENKVSLDIQYCGISDSEDFKLIKEMAVDGKSHFEMAQSRGISLSACKKRVQRAKDNLRKKIIL